MLFAFRWYDSLYFFLVILIIMWIVIVRRWFLLNVWVMLVWVSINIIKLLFIHNTQLFSVLAFVLSYWCYVLSIVTMEWNIVVLYTLFLINKKPISGDHADDGDEFCSLLLSGFWCSCSKLMVSFICTVDTFIIEYCKIQWKWKAVIVLLDICIYSIRKWYYELF